MFVNKLFLVIFVLTRPKPSYGRRGLDVGSSGQDTVLGCSQRGCPPEPILSGEDSGWSLAGQRPVMGRAKG